MNESHHELGQVDESSTGQTDSPWRTVREVAAISRRHRMTVLKACLKTPEDPGHLPSVQRAKHATRYIHVDNIGPWMEGLRPAAKRFTYADVAEAIARAA